MEVTADGPKLRWSQGKEFDNSVTNFLQGTSIAPTSPGSQHNPQYDYAEKGNQPMLKSVYLGIDDHVFDDAEKSIRYLVLMNTWRKFVKAREDTMEV
ncbi:hypothetical protein LTR56_024811 [Elasticomyces elasticus]|nr:hypothetical protein LTR56_024811 [Elasticomyces elasticus]KAK3621792.1 hypothetical protein LTR22_025055 [Elasticomyces elasticus]KAK4906627.1 hypothetical protein LTR49_024240 [Elasticomyces elasticus]